MANNIHVLFIIQFILMNGCALHLCAGWGDSCQGWIPALGRKNPDQSVCKNNENHINSHTPIPQP